MPTNLEITLTTNHNLCTVEKAQSVYRLITRHLNLAPVKYGECEPLRKIFSVDDEGFVRDWYSQNDSAFGSMIWERTKKPNIDGMATFGKGKYPEFNRISWMLPLENFNSYEEFLNDVAEFFGHNEFLFGRICLKDEYYKNNILKDTTFFYNKQGEKILHPPGSTSPILPVGLNLRKHIPGLYWRTFFGKVYVDWFGKEKIITTPAYSILELPKDAVCLQMYEKPEMFEESNVEDVIKKAKNHLGEEAFFDKADLERETKAPLIDVSEITL